MCVSHLNLSTKIFSKVKRSKMEKIDLHAHCVPASYREYCLENDFAGRGHPDGMPAIPVSYQPAL